MTSRRRMPVVWLELTRTIGEVLSCAHVLGAVFIFALTNAIAVVGQSSGRRCRMEPRCCNVGASLVIVSASTSSYLFRRRFRGDDVDHIDESGVQKTQQLKNITEGEA